MNIWNKVLLGLIFVVSLAFLYFAMDALKTRQYWKKSAEKHEQKIAQLPVEIDNIKFGPDGQSGLKKVRTELYKYLIARGRVWNDCKPQKVVDPKTGEIQVAISSAAGHGISDRMTVYAFDQLPFAEGGRYLGEFKVKGVADKSIGLAPAMHLTDTQLKHLTESKGPWTLCEIMPADSHELFAGVGEEELKKQFPNADVAEFLADGKEDKVRPLRDYGFLLKEYDRKRAILIELQESISRRKTFTEKALTDAKAQVEFRKKQVAGLEVDLKRMQQERDAALAYQKSLETELKERQSKIKMLIQKNRKMAADIAKMQSEALDRWNSQLAESVK
jgi:hypothetical protein